MLRTFRSRDVRGKDREVAQGDKVSDSILVVVEVVEQDPIMFWVAVPMTIDVIDRIILVEDADERTSSHVRNLSKKRYYYRVGVDF